MRPEAFVATLIAPPNLTLSQAHLEEFEAYIRISGGNVRMRNWIDLGNSADIFFSGDIPFKHDFPFDVLIQKSQCRQKKILVADMESTIIEQEIIDELGARAGLDREIATITARAMNGEIDFAHSLCARVALLKDQSESLLQDISSAITVMPGAQYLLDVMRKEGATCWLVSGGFTYFARKIAERLGFHKFYANELIVVDGHITGKVGLPILDQNSKLAALKEVCANLKCDLSDCLVVGDGANDIAMLQACAKAGGLAVAYHAKPAVKKCIDNQINFTDLSSLVWAQGLH